jgi:hypothetical protein
LRRLQLERRAATAAGLDRCPPYMADLRAEIAECRQALVTEAAFAVAIVRGALFGRQVG